MKHLFRGFQNILFPISNIEAVVIELCKTAGISVSKSDISDALKRHPDYPSLLSISDVLEDIDIPSKGFYLKDKHNLINITSPWIAQVKMKEETFFTLVYLCSGDNVTWWNPTSKKKEVISYASFIDYFTGYGLAVSTENLSDRIMEKPRAKQNSVLTSRQFFLLPLLLISLLLFYPAFGVVENNHRTVNFLLCFLFFLGGIISVILIFLEKGHTHHVINRLCHVGANISCSSVVNSPLSKVLGISTATLGLTYFLGMILWVTFHSYDCTIMSLSSWLHLSTLPVVFFSLYYQYRVIKKWCPLCMMVQVVIITIFITCLLTKQFISIPSFNVMRPYFFTGLICFSFSFCLGYILEVWLNTDYQKSVFQGKMKKLLYDHDVFYALLQKERWTTPPDNSMGIFQGNMAGTTHVVMVCNPYCTPCAKTHKMINSLLLTNSNIKLQIIFFTKENPNQRKIVSHFLSLYYNKSIPTSDFFEKWYEEKEMTPEVFSSFYNLEDTNISEYENKIEQMNDWCKIEEVQYTPTIYINGCKIPLMYDASDIKYFLRE